MNQDLYMAALKSAIQAFKNISELDTVESILLRDVNDDALFSDHGRQLVMISQVFVLNMAVLSVILSHVFASPITLVLFLILKYPCDIISS